MVVKPVLSKLIKPYQIYLDQHFKINSVDKLETIKEEVFYSTTYMYPTQNLTENTTIDLPLELFDISRKNLKLVYLVNEIDHENRKVKAKLNELRTIYYHSGVSNPSFNINVLIQDKYYAVLKVLLAHKAGGIKCSKARTTQIRIACEQIFKSQYSEVSQVLEDIYHKTLTQKILSKMSSNTEYIKGIVVTKFINL